LAWILRIKPPQKNIAVLLSFVRFLLRSSASVCISVRESTFVLLVV
jgi:hypothetical protein